jgi:phospholipase/carboxylesterase
MRDRPAARTDLTRRRFLGLGTTGVAAALLARCSFNSAANASAEGVLRGRLSARVTPPSEPIATGTHALGLGATRDGRFYVPSGYRAEAPAPLVLMLHGAGGNSAGALRRLQPLADEAGLILLAPESRGATWDVILGGFGPDVEFIDRALGRLFRCCAVDPARVVVEGFSDGASYALSLGLTNGDFFSRVVAFSPGLMLVSERHGKPPIFIAHGRSDAVLDIDVSSRRFVPSLRGEGYAVRYEEFEGGHTVLPNLAREAVKWLAAPG